MIKFSNHELHIKNKNKINESDTNVIVRMSLRVVQILVVVAVILMVIRHGVGYSIPIRWVGTKRRTQNSNLVSTVKTNCKRS
jgi:hypothetical protein